MEGVFIFYKERSKSERQKKNFKNKRRGSASPLQFYPTKILLQKFLSCDFPTKLSALNNLVLLVWKKEGLFLQVGNFGEVKKLEEKGKDSFLFIVLWSFGCVVVCRNVLVV